MNELKSKILKEIAFIASDYKSPNYHFLETLHVCKQAKHDKNEVLKKIINYFENEKYGYFGWYFSPKRFKSYLLLKEKNNYNSQEMIAMFESEMKSFFAIIQEVENELKSKRNITPGLFEFLKERLILRDDPNNLKKMIEKYPDI